MFGCRRRRLAGGTATDFPYGDAQMRPIAGAWNRDGRDTVGMRSGSTFFLRNTNDAGVHDISFDFGPADGIPLFGG